ncbi:MAG: cysteine--tRNA ligase, partial [Candidatus Micrarchaeia archaeon]
MMELYNTLTHRIEKFRPLRGNIVTYYACGPSVYLQPHVGNFKTYTFEDVLRRWLEYRGFKVKHVMNITDVEDKGVRQAKGSKKKMLQQTRRNSAMFFRDAKRLGLLRPKIVCKATEHVPGMIKVIAKLMKRGYAYRWKEDGNIYYDISKFKKYGALSRTPVKKFVKSERRVSKDDYWQFEMGDFVLWKARRHPDGDIFWRSPWGEGRPGWNIECSAMSMRYLGEAIDVHAGGSDLVFSHHENEIAQSEGATGKQFVRY